MPDRSHAVRILVVDDSESSRELVYWCLGGPSSPFSLDRAASGEEATEFLDAGSYDLVITDQYMPGLKGVGLLARMRTHARHRGTPAILMSSDDSQELRRAALEAGASCVVVKPFTPQELMTAVDGALRGSRESREVAAPRLMQAILDAMPHLAMILDSQHHVVAGNAAFYATTGSGISDVPICCAAAVHGDAGEPVECPLTESMRTGCSARKLVRDERLGPLDVEVFPLHLVSDSGRQLYLHIARPAGIPED